MIDLNVLGQNIRRERKRQCLTIEQLAEKAGISDNFLGKIERGDGNPSLTTMDAIACALHVSIDFLKGDTALDTEHKFLEGMMEMNRLSGEKREKFIDFISTNIKYVR